MQFRRLFVFILIIFLLGVISVNWDNWFTAKVIYEKEEVFIEKVIDGDTFESDIGRIRLLGINTPERGKKYYDEAKNFLKEFENETVEVVRDREDSDRYGRKLRYIFYDERFLNVEILQEGLATSFLVEDLKYEDKLKSAEEFARKRGRNLWEKSNDICAECIELIKLDEKEEFFVIKNVCSIDCNLDGWLVKDNANHFFKLDDLDSGKNKKYESKNIWNNDGDRLFMYDDEGKLVIFYEY